MHGEYDGIALQSRKRRLVKAGIARQILRCNEPASRSGWYSAIPHCSLRREAIVNGKGASNCDLFLGTQADRRGGKRPQAFESPKYKLRVAEKGEVGVHKRSTHPLLSAIETQESIAERYPEPCSGLHLVSKATQMGFIVRGFTSIRDFAIRALKLIRLTVVGAEVSWFLITHASILAPT